MASRQFVFPGMEKPKIKKRKLMRATDAGYFPDGRSAAYFQCPHCGHDDGWSGVGMAQAKRGIPCPNCNKSEELDEA